MTEGSDRQVESGNSFPWLHKYRGQESGEIGMKEKLVTKLEEPPQFCVFFVLELSKSDVGKL